MNKSREAARALVGSEIAGPLHVVAIGKAVAMAPLRMPVLSLMEALSRTSVVI